MNEFRSMKDLWNETWDTREAAEDELKRNSFPTKASSYQLAQTPDGRWHLTKSVTSPPPAQAAQMKRGARPGPTDVVTGKQLPRPKHPATSKGDPPKKPAAVKKAAAPKEAAKGGPNEAKLPEGFAEWAVTQAMSDEGVMRSDLTERSKQNCTWRDYLSRIAKPGYQVVMDKVGRANRFKMIKPS